VKTYRIHRWETILHIIDIKAESKNDAIRMKGEIISEDSSCGEEDGEIECIGIIAKNGELEEAKE